MRRPASALIAAAGVLALALGGIPQPASAAGTGYTGVLPPKGAAAAGAHKVLVCSSCHGLHGNSMTSSFPNLAGQNYNYLLKQLQDFRSGARKASTMDSMIKTIPKSAKDANIEAIAAYFAKQKYVRSTHANTTEKKPSKALVEEGYRIYQWGLPGRKVPACAACHMPSGLGNAPMAIPALAGQHAVYLDTELNRFADGKRHNSPGNVMEHIARRLLPQQRAAVAAYAQAMKPALAAGIGPKTFRAYTRQRASEPVPGVPSSNLAPAAVPPKKAAAKKAAQKHATH